MGSRFASGALAVVLALGVTVTLSIAAAPKQYQWTGTVTEVDPKAKTLVVDKAGEVWEFSTEGLKDLKAKKGDKVTVHYVAIAKRVEVR
jgi:hypothetical protein